MKQLLATVFIAILFCSFTRPNTLAGIWNYAGGIENGKYDGPPTDYTLQRRYDAARFTAFALQKGYKPEKYETGSYVITADTCLETQTWCSQPSKLIGVAVHYQYILRNDSLILSGILPNGSKVTEYWKWVK